MNILLDTHIALWALLDSSKLNNTAIELISDPNNTIYFSAASIWELNIKYNSSSNLPFDGNKFQDMCETVGFVELPIFSKHIRELVKLDIDPSNPIHKDPFDRIMLCQSISENINFITHDTLINKYNIPSVIYI